MADFSCYIKCIDNTEGLYPLELTGKSAAHGDFVGTCPPDRIEVGAIWTTDIRLKDRYGASGSSGTIGYRLGCFDKDANECPNVTFTFTCPFNGNNAFGISYDHRKYNLSNEYATYEGAISEDKHYHDNFIDPDGNPVYIKIKIKPVANGKQFLARMT